MKELERIYSKKTILLLLILCVVNFALFLFSTTPDKQITLTGEELSDYIASYPAFLERTAENSRLLSTLDLYQKGYAFEVLKKSEKVYRKLAGVVPREGENVGIVLLLQYHISDIFLLVFLLIVAAECLAERRKGLAGMVRSTDRGREILYLQRIGILAFSAVLAAVLLYAGDYLGLRIAFGPCDLSRSIQSLPEFMLCPYRLSIGGYLALSVLIKSAGCLLAAILFFLLISVLGTTAAYAAAGGLAVLWFFLHLLVGPVSAWNVLRYLNLYTVISCVELFEDYCLINLFGKALPAMAGILIFLAILSGLGLLAGWYIHGKQYVLRRQVGERFMDRIAFWRERFSFQHTLAGWEGYKLFVLQGGLVLITAAFLLHLVMSAQYRYNYAEDELTALWYRVLGGEMTEESLAKAEREKELLEKEIVRQQDLIERLSQENPVDTKKVSDTTQALANTVKRRDALVPILNDLRDGMRYSRKTGRKLVLMKPMPYELLIRRDVKTRDRASLLILIAVIGSVSGIFAYDAENHMRDTLHTAYRGRARTTAVKLGVVFVCCVVTAVALHLIQFAQVGHDIGYHDLDAPVQSLMFMREFALYIPIWQYFALLFGLRAAAAFGVGLLVALVSRMCSDTVTAMGISAFLFVVPIAFAQVVPLGKYLSVIEMLGGAYFR